MNFFDRLFPGRALKREELERVRLENETQKKYATLMEAYMTQELNLSEAPVNTTSPWFNDLTALTISSAWKQGYPGTELAYAADDATVASDDSLRNLILKICRALYSGHPHARGIIENAVSFVVGSRGWTIEPSPKITRRRMEKIYPVTEARGDHDYIEPLNGITPVPEDPDDVPGDPRLLSATMAYQNRTKDDKPVLDIPLSHKMKAMWKRYIRKGVFHPRMGWKQFWREAYRRTQRDGEVFIYLGHSEEDGRLSMRFLEPEDIVHPANASTVSNVFDPRANGIEVDPEDPTKILYYYFKRHDRLTATVERLDANDVLHVKIGVDENVRRGLPKLYISRNMLRHFDSWIQQSLKHQRVQTSIALLRQWEKGQAGVATNAMIDSQKFRGTNVKTPAGSSIEYRTTDVMPVIDAPKGMTMTMASPSGNFGDSQILARRVLLSVAVGSQQSEAMVTGDGSNANYASTRITQIPSMRHFEDEQGDWNEIVEEVYRRWCYCEMAQGRLPRDLDEDALDCNVTANPLPNFEAEIVAPTMSSLNASKSLSKRTLHEMIGIDPDTEEERLSEEQQRDLEVQQAAQAQPQAPEEPMDQPEEFGTQQDQPEEFGTQRDQEVSDSSAEEPGDGSNYDFMSAFREDDPEAPKYESAA
jgi:capsid protein